MEYGRRLLPRFALDPEAADRERLAPAIFALAHGCEFGRAGRRGR